MTAADVVVVGGGIVGLATAHTLLERRPQARVAVLEKEGQVAAHQTGRNSGVVHSGIYYRPGSLKARNCRRGKALLEEFCRRHDVPFERCGKVVVAVDAGEIPRLAEIARRAEANGVAFEAVGPERLRELEPAARGVRALHVPETGIVDYPAMCRRLASLITGRGGELRLGARVTGIAREAGGLRVETTHGDIPARLVVNCAGLQSDLVLQSAGERRPARILPFRGEYFALVPSARGLVRNLIYPVPDPSFPFLGVHFTRMVAGGVECGPNAVLALAREGYTWRNVSLRDSLDALAWPGFWRLARRHWRAGAGEVWRSLSRRAFTRALQRLVPAIQPGDLVPAEAGVRAQAVGRQGALLDDFVIEERPGVIHVLNAPSPAATASLAIAGHLVDLMEARL